MKKDTTMSISKLNKIRIESILKGGQSLDFGVKLLLLCFAKPKFAAGGILGRGMTIYPPFTDDEIQEIIEELRKHSEIMPSKTPKEIIKELEKIKEEE